MSFFDRFKKKPAPVQENPIAKQDPRDRLTPEQHALVRPLIDDIRECPLPTQEWCEVWGVTWKNVI